MAFKSFMTLSLAAATGCIAASLVATQAQSADLPDMPELYTEAGPAPALTWAGSYIGLQAGAGQLAGEVTSGSKKEFDKGGFTGGVYAGHNWEVSRFVLGLEADFTYMGHKKTFSHASLGTVKARNNWSAGLKGRVGLPIDRFMPYLSAGVTASDYKLTANGTSKNSKSVSINFGAGLEYAMSDQLRLRADYSINGVNHMTETFGGSRVKSEAASHRLMLGVSYNF